MRILHFNGESDLEIFPDNQEDANTFLYAAAAHERKTPEQSALLINIARAVNESRHTRGGLSQLDRAMQDARITNAGDETAAPEYGFKGDEATFIFESLHELAEYKGSHHIARSRAAQLMLQNAYETPAIEPQPQTSADNHQAGFIRI